MAGGSPAFVGTRFNGAVERWAASDAYHERRWFSASRDTSSKVLLRPHRLNESGGALRAVKAFYRAALLPPQFAGG
jgi:hypothetical protein